VSERARLATIVLLVLLGVVSAADIMISAVIRDERRWRALVIACPIVFVALVTSGVALIRLGA
jgi:hypothetical protein